MVLPLLIALMACADADQTPATDTPATRPTNPPAGSAPGTAPRSGSVAVDQAVVDLGFLLPRATVTHTFKVTNTGPVALTVVAAEPSCTCTTTLDLKGKVIEPGATLEVPTSMKVPSSTGQKQVLVQLVLRGIPEVVQLQLKGEIAYAVRATTTVGGQEVPYIDAASDPTRVKGVVHLKSTDGAPFRVRAVQGEPPVVSSFDPAKDAPRTEYTVAYDLTRFPSIPPYLVIETDHPGARLIDLRVRHETTKITPALRLSEFRANAGCVKAGTPVPLDVEIKSMGTLELVGLASKDPRFTATLIGSHAEKAVRNVAFTVTPRPDTRGFALFPVTFTARDPASGRTIDADLLVYITVEP